MDTSNKRDRLYKYGEAIVNAKLDGGAKMLLWHYAFAYNWTEGRRSFWTEERICAHTSMAPSTFQKRKKYLKDLGWLDIVKVSLKRPPLVKPTYGRDDPAYESKHWAKWHASKLKEVNLGDLASLSDLELKELAIVQDHNMISKEVEDEGYEDLPWAEGPINNDEW
jgi:hypothetical protein